MNSPEPNKEEMYDLKIGNTIILFPYRYMTVLAKSTVGKFPLRAMQYLDKKLDRLTKEGGTAMDPGDES